jgi:hypothetical protein
MNSNLETLNLSAEQLEALKNGGRLDMWGETLMVIKKIPPRTEPASNKSKKEIEFYQFPKAVVDALVQVNYAPAWALAAAVYKGWYDDFKKHNPVKLTSALLAEFRVSKDQKSKGLKLLEQSDQFLVERFRDHNPLITMKWKLIKD